jgi:guanylate kinase
MSVRRSDPERAAPPVPSGFRRLGFPFVVTGPSGVGKTSLLEPLLAHPGVVFSVSATTRARRASEAHGREYWFHSEEEFRRKLAAGEFVEHADVHGRLYGTPKAPLDAWIADGKAVVLDVDVQGGASLRKAYPDGAFVFILPPSLEELRRRLAGRGSESADTLERRMRDAPVEIAEYRHYQYVVVNDDLARAREELTAILLAERRRLVRLAPRLPT